MRIWPRKAGCDGRGGGGGGGWVPGPGPHLPPGGERQARYCKSGSLDSRYSSRTGGLTGLAPHLVSPHGLTGLHLVPPPQTNTAGGRNRSRSRTRQRITEENTAVVADLNSKKISRVESLKNLILHGKAEPDLPPDVFNYPPHCSCR